MESVKSLDCGIMGKLKNKLYILSRHKGTLYKLVTIKLLEKPSTQMLSLNCLKKILKNMKEKERKIKSKINSANKDVKNFNR